MKYINRIIPSILLLILLISCSEKKEARLQRFLEKGNEMVKRQNYPEAMEYYQEAIELDSCYPDAWNNIGILQYRQGKLLEAMSSYNQALTCKSTYTDALYNRAMVFYELKNYSNALNDIDQVQRVYPDSSTIHFMRGLIQVGLQEYAHSIESFQKASANDSLNAEVLVNLGSAYYFFDDFANADRYLKKALTLNPEEIFAYNTLSLIEIEKGEYQQALDLITTALAFEVDNPYLINNRGYVYLLIDSLDKAQADIDMSIKLDTDNAWAYRNKGIFYLKTGKYEDAVRLLNQSIKMDASVDPVYFYLSEAYLQLGKWDEACNAWKESVNKDEQGRTTTMKPCK